MTWIVSNAYLSEAQMQNNAKELYSFVASRGGSVNVAAALCGNAQQESTLNPGVWQNLTVNTGGYGLFQWDPATKLTNWCYAEGIESADGVSQMRCLYEHTVALGQWSNINNGATHKSDWLDSWYVPFGQFLSSKNDPATLAGNFVCCFEKPGSILYGDRSSQEAEITKRGNYAKNWYTFLTGQEPPGPSPGGELPENIRYAVYALCGSQKRRNIYVKYR